MGYFKQESLIVILLTFSVISCENEEPSEAFGELEVTRENRAIAANPVGISALLNNQPTQLATVNGRQVVGTPFIGSPITNAAALRSAIVVSATGPLVGLAEKSNVGGPPPVTLGPGLTAGTTVKPPTTTAFIGYIPDKPYPFVLPPPDIPYFGSKYVGPFGYPIGHYQAFRGTGQYITHYDYYPQSYFGSLMAPLAYGMSGKK